MGEDDLQQLIRGCLSQDRICQKMLYRKFYGFAMGICLRYANNRDDACGVMNQGFFKVFTQIETYDDTRPFKAWLGRIMINASIDHYRAGLKLAFTDELDRAEGIHDGSSTDSKLNYDDLLKMVQKLPPAYRTVFNLFVIEGYTHDEIGEQLSITSGTSKSNLHKAREKLKQMIADVDSPAGNNGYDKNDGYTPIVAMNSVKSPNPTITGIPGYNVGHKKFL